MRTLKVLCMQPPFLYMHLVNQMSDFADERHILQRIQVYLYSIRYIHQRTQVYLYSIRYIHQHKQVYFHQSIWDT